MPVPDEPLLEDGLDRAAVDPVAVVFAGGVARRAEEGRRLGHLDNGDVGRQPAVQRRLKAGGPDPVLRPEGCHLPQSVDAGVGAAGALEDRSLAQNRRQHFDERPLDRRQTRLLLPPVVGGAVVPDRHAEASHGEECSVSAGRGHQQSGAGAGRSFPWPVEWGG